MSRNSRMMLPIIALSFPLIGRCEEPAAKSADAWPPLTWKKAAPSPFERVESPTAVVGNKLYLFGGFTNDLGASNQLDVYNPGQRLMDTEKGHADAAHPPQSSH